MILNISTRQSELKKGLLMKLRTRYHVMFGTDLTVLLLSWLKSKPENYQIARADGAKAINDIDKDETSLDILRQNQRFLIHWKLLLQQLYRWRCHFLSLFCIVAIWSVFNLKRDRLSICLLCGEILFRLWPMGAYLDCAVKERRIEVH